MIRYPDDLKPDVSDEELAGDLADIAEGADAFRMIADGYAILARVDDAPNRSMHAFKSNSAAAKAIALDSSVSWLRHLTAARQAFRDQQESPQPAPNAATRT